MKLHYLFCICGFGKSGTTMTATASTRLQLCFWQLITPSKSAILCLILITSYYVPPALPHRTCSTLLQKVCIEKLQLKQPAAFNRRNVCNRGSSFNFIFALHILRRNYSGRTHPAASALPNTPNTPTTLYPWNTSTTANVLHPSPSLQHTEHIEALRVKSSMALSWVCESLAFTKAATNDAFAFNRVTSSNKRLRAWPQDKPRKPHAYNQPPTRVWSLPNFQTD